MKLNFLIILRMHGTCFVFIVFDKFSDTHFDKTKRGYNRKSRMHLRFRGFIIILYSFLANPNI